MDFFFLLGSAAGQMELARAKKKKTENPPFARFE
jgi:hypothetical protein